MIKLPPIFSDGMVLQANQPVKVWGSVERKGDYTAGVTLTIQEKSVSTDFHDGRFEAVLPALSYSDAETLVICCGEEELTIRDIAVGEVWFTSGQSNMEFQMFFDRDFDKVEPDKKGRIRHFGVAEIAYPEAISEFDYSDWNIWRKNDTKDNLEFFTAVGYYFAERIAKEIGCVVGLVNCAWGGTAAHTWIDPAYLNGTKGQIWLDESQKSLSGHTEDELLAFFRKTPLANRSHLFGNSNEDAIMIGLSHEEQANLLDSMPVGMGGAPMPMYHSTPGRLYETMVKTVAPYTVKGIVWYQGESDCVHAEAYADTLMALIRCFRDLWCEQLPFYLVQLPSYGEWMGLDGKDWPIVRRCQEEVADSIANTYLVATMDCGMLYDIHPKSKRTIGIRLGSLALKNEYALPLLAGSPRPIQVTANIGEICLAFSDSEGGLTHAKELEGDSSLQIQIAGSRLLPDKWYIEGNEMVVQSRHFEKRTKAKLLFAEEGYAPVNVFSQAGFSIRPFTVDVEID